MIGNRFPAVLGAVAVLAVLGAPVRGSEGVPDPSAQREFNAKLGVCGACHGVNGIPKNANIPIIWGQREDYLVNQLHDFDSGTRAFEVMAWMSKSLGEDDHGPAAAYFAKKDWPAHAAGTTAAALPKGMVICQACHQSDFSGGQLVPRLAGQSYEYLNEQMRRFAQGERTNNADMVKIMQAISPADRETMARYLAGL
jgi:cytochrome c553